MPITYGGSDSYSVGSVLSKFYNSARGMWSKIPKPFGRRAPAVVGKLDSVVAEDENLPIKPLVLTRDGSPITSQAILRENFEGVMSGIQSYGAGEMSLESIAN